MMNLFQAGFLCLIVLFFVTCLFLNKEFGKCNHKGAHCLCLFGQCYFPLAYICNYLRSVTFHWLIYAIFIFKFSLNKWRNDSCRITRAFPDL